MSVGGAGINLRLRRLQRSIRMPRRGAVRGGDGKGAGLIEHGSIVVDVRVMEHADRRDVLT